MLLCVHEHLTLPGLHHLLQFHFTMEKVECGCSVPSFIDVSCNMSLKLPRISSPQNLKGSGSQERLNVCIYVVGSMADSSSLSALQRVGKLERATGSCWSLLWHLWGSTRWEGFLACLAPAKAQPFCSMVQAPHLPEHPIELL